MQERKKTRTKRSHTVEDTGSHLMQTMHPGMNYFHELNFPQFKIRKTTHKPRIHNHTFHSQSAIENTQIHEPLQDNKKKHLATTNTKVGEVVKKAVQEVYPKNIVYSVQISQIKA